MDSLTPLQGMKDVFDSRARSKRIMLNNLVEFLESSNFDQIDLPLLEGTDLLLKKSGGTLASKMYSFEDPGGRNISLRPEFTSSVVRAYLNEDIDPKITTKVFYYGQIFRYSTENVVNLREYTQVGCEVIGASTHSSDIELLMTAIKGTNLFLKDCSMRIGHMGIINQILNELNLSDRLKFFISEHLNIIKEGDSGINRLKEMALKLLTLAIEDSCLDASHKETYLNMVNNGVMATTVDIIVDATKGKLAVNKTIKKAKGILVQVKNVINGIVSFYRKMK